MHICSGTFTQHLAFMNIRLTVSLFNPTYNLRQKSVHSSQNQSCAVVRIHSTCIWLSHSYRSFSLHIFCCFRCYEAFHSRKWHSPNFSCQLYCFFLHFCIYIWKNKLKIIKRDIPIVCWTNKNMWKINCSSYVYNTSQCLSSNQPLFMWCFVSIW